MIPRNLSLLVLDFDGVLTDNMVYVSQSGEEMVRCSKLDSMGLALLKKIDVPIWVLSSEANPVVSKRCEKLKINCIQNCDNKPEALRMIAANEHATLENTVFVGNDVNDLECLQLVGCAVVVADAHPDAKKHAHLVLSKKGGEGAVRELCDLILWHFPSNRIAA